MLSASGRRGSARGVVAGVSAAALACAVAFGPLAMLATTAAAAGPCATPGASGAGGSLTGVVNTYYPGTASVAAGRHEHLGRRLDRRCDTDRGRRHAPGHPDAGRRHQLRQHQRVRRRRRGRTGVGLHGAELLRPVRVRDGDVGGVRRRGHDQRAGRRRRAGQLLHARRQRRRGAGQRTFQVVRVPQYTTASTSSTLTAAAWNGSTGGVLALDTTEHTHPQRDGECYRPRLPRRSELPARRRRGRQHRRGAGVERGQRRGEGRRHRRDALVLGRRPTPTPVATWTEGAPGNAGGGGTDGNPVANDQNSGGGGWRQRRGRRSRRQLVEHQPCGRRVRRRRAAGNRLAGLPRRRRRSRDREQLRRTATPTGRPVAAPSSSAPRRSAAPARSRPTARPPTTPRRTTVVAVVVPAGRSIWSPRPARWLVRRSTPTAGAAATRGRRRPVRRVRTVLVVAGAAAGCSPRAHPPRRRSTAGTHGITTTGNLAFGSTDGSVGQTATTSTTPGVNPGAACADLSITKTAPASVQRERCDRLQPGRRQRRTCRGGLVVGDGHPPGRRDVRVGVRRRVGMLERRERLGDLYPRRPSPSGATAPTITVNVTAPAQATTLSNTATVTSTTPDQTPANNTSTASTTVDRHRGPGDHQDRPGDGDRRRQRQLHARRRTTSAPPTRPCCP